MSEDTYAILDILKEQIIEDMWNTYNQGMNAPGIVQSHKALMCKWIDGAWNQNGVCLKFEEGNSRLVFNSLELRSLAQREELTVCFIQHDNREVGIKLMAKLPTWEEKHFARSLKM